jgi:hypothetical protein
MKWFRTEGGIEYSDDFNFFLEHQVLASVRKEGYPTLKLICRQSGIILSQKKDVFGREDFADKRIKELAKEIHSEILTAKRFREEIVE